MACPSCGTENPAGAKFCNGCGAALNRLCGTCGAANAASARFCSECGGTLAEGAAPPPPPPVPSPVAERRLVSVLFADLVGFTTLSESRDSEEVRELLSRYFDSCRRLISLYGGTVEKFIGDAVMAVWGTPTATEDDAERAVRAALDLVAAVSALGDEIGAPTLRARAGVLTGEAAVTIGAQGEGMVAGDLVNTASRIQSAAEPGTVLVGEATRRATEQTVAYDTAGSFELKGKDGLTPLWHARRVISGARGALRSQGLEAPFVGRDRELRLIKDLFHASADENKAHLVSVTGIAGTGKSRLGWEFYKYFDGLPQLTYWHRGRCLSYGDGVTYWALADMVRMRARIAEEEEADSAREKLRAVVEEHVPDLEERRFVEPRLMHLLALEEGLRYEREDLFAAWRLFFERLADVYPTVLAFEDMQWADAALLDFVEYLLEWSRSSPLFVITLARPELVDRRPTWGTGRRNFSSLYLEPLGTNAMGELLTGLVPGLPEDVRREILDRAEGVPLYAVETVRMLLDRGLLVQDGAAYSTTGAIEGLAVPETLQSLIAARLDGLPPTERHLVQDGAVLGKTFTKSALAALSGLQEAELDPLLTSLVRKEVFGVQADPRSPEHGQYGFLQDLLRRVAYDTLARGDRKAKHLAAAAWLEQALAEQEVVEVLASHLLDAYEAAPDAPDAGAIRARAGAQLARAGERAASLGANEEAMRYFEQAAELAEDELARAELHELAGRRAWAAGVPDRARPLLEQAVTVFEAQGLPRAAALVQACLGEIDFAHGDPTGAAARVAAALDSLVGEPDETVARVAGQLGRFLAVDNRYDDAWPHLELALSLGEALDLPGVVADAITSKSTLLNHANRLAEARILLEGAFELALASDVASAGVRAANNLAVVFESADDYAKAIETCERGLELARRIGDRVWEATFLAGPITSLNVVGRWDEALAVAAEVEALEDIDFIAILVLHTIGIHVERGDLELARSALERRSTARDSNDATARHSYALFDARIMRADGNPAALSRATEAFDEASKDVGVADLTSKLALVEALESAVAFGEAAKADELLSFIEALRPGERPPVLEAHAHRFRAVLGGDVAGFRFAAEIFRPRSLRFWLAVTLLEHGERLALDGRSDEAAALLAEAREIFTELGARPWLERLEATAGSPAASVA